MRVGRFCEIPDNSIVRKGETIIKRTGGVGKGIVTGTDMDKNV
jgi:hypothetical protein